MSIKCYSFDTLTEHVYTIDICIYLLRLASGLSIDWYYLEIIMKNLDIDFIKLRNRVCELEKELYKEKQSIVWGFIINIVLLVLTVLGLHACLVSLGVGAAL